MPSYNFSCDGAKVPSFMGDEVTVDYPAWVQQLQSFIFGLRSRSPEADRNQFQVEVQAPLSVKETDGLERTHERPLPVPMRAFLEQASSGVALRYECAGPTGPVGAYDFSICPAAKLENWRGDCLAAVAGGWMAQDREWPLDRAFWRHAQPFAGQDHIGDYLALWSHDPDDPNPPVLCLNHESSSWIIAPSFNYFLHLWACLGYIGICHLANYCEPGCGFLDSTTEKARVLRSCLELEL